MCVVCMCVQGGPRWDVYRDYVYTSLIVSEDAWREFPPE